MRYLIAIFFAATCSIGAQTNEIESALPAPLSSPQTDVDATVYALSIVFACTFLLTFYVGVLYFRQRERTRVAPLGAGQNNLALMATAALEPETGSALEWKERALSAEALANNQALLLREKLMPELTEFVKQSLVQGLAAQRDVLLAMQQQALQSLIEMEARLASMQAPLQDRIRAYENRITELEKEIIAQGAEMRELTRTILGLMRKKLDEEKAQASLPESFT